MTKSRGIRRSKGVREAWAKANADLHHCHCGCGAMIEVRPEHIHEGVPQYVHGHNRRGKRQPSLPRMLCECGCEQLAGPGKRFISGHNGRGLTRSLETKAKLRAAHLGERSHRYGKRPPNYKGRLVVSGGYIYLHTPDHPFANKKGYVMEHRLVVERHLRETTPASPFLTTIDGLLVLRRDVEVHHRNEIKDDNRLENLEPMTRAEHARHHDHITLANTVRMAKVRERAENRVVKICTYPDCDSPQKTVGLCNAHYLKKRRGVLRYPE